MEAEAPQSTSAAREAEEDAAHAEEEASEEGTAEEAALVDKVKSLVEVKDRRWRLHSYKQCFVGAEAVDVMVNEGLASSRKEGVKLGQKLLDAGWLFHVTRDHPFKDDFLFYRFKSEELSVKGVPQNNKQWKDVLPKFSRIFASNDDSVLGQPDIEKEVDDILQDLDPNDPLLKALLGLEVSPLDEHNLKLLSHVHPPEWQAPSGEEAYNLVVIGAGTAGLVSAAAAAGLGARVALIERHLMGGDCLNVGCVPSKALLACAKRIKQVRNSAEFGVRIEGSVTVDFPAIMERMRRIRAEISWNDSASRFAERLGVDVFFGSGRFVNKDTVSVGDKMLTFARAVIATGARAAVPPILGLKDTPFLINETVFNLTELPPRLAVLGGGPIGCELAQAFALFGSQVSILLRSEHILSQEEEKAARIVEKALLRDGVQIHRNLEIGKVSYDEESGVFRISHLSGTIEAEHLLVATGRSPNIKGIGLDEAGVKYTKRGVVVSDQLQTSNHRIFAAGDVCGDFKFTHVADFHARTLLRNAFFFGRSKTSGLTIPWCTYTDPEIAHVGLYEKDAKHRNIEIEAFELPFADNDRNICEGETEGYIRVLVQRGTDKIVGATICAANAGDLINEFTICIVNQVGLGTLAGVIHPYPTTAELVRKTGDAFNRTRLTPTVKMLFRKFLASRR